MAYAQDKRIGVLKPPSGLDGLVLRTFTASEGVSELFEFRVQAISEDKNDLDLGKAIGQMATVTIGTYGGKSRIFAGMLADARHEGIVGNGFGYLLVLRPPAWFLSKRINSRAFAKQTVPFVIDAILTEGGVEHTMSVEGSFPSLDYIVQHRESDLAFIMRLMEAHGIRYHFEFADGSCKMIVSNGSPKDLPGGNKRKYFGVNDRHIHAEEFVTDWFPQRHFTAATVKSSDYNFLTSTTDLAAEKQATVPFDKKLVEYVQLHEQSLGKEANPGKSTDYAQIRLDARRSEDDRHVAGGDAVSLTPGFVMELEKHPAFSKRYLIVRCSHHFSAQVYMSGGEDEETDYTGIYEMLPESQQFRPPMVTPRPLISGVQTGKVLGGEDDSKDIDVDEYGRILVHMHWNTDSPTKPEGQTMRCRVLQAWAGTDWGTMFIPRKGMEVLVQHIDGDPDRPVVIGCVYNDKHMPPWKLGGKKNIAGWKSRSTEGGGADDYNEFSFDDTKGSEKVVFNAQKDLESVIENSEKRTIKAADRTTVLEQGNDSLKADVGKIAIEAAQEIKLTVGQSVITLTQQGITIEALMIKVDAQVQLQTHGLMAEHKADAMMTIKGGIIMIN